ncbi:M28 family metallopeptidase [Sphingomonas rosea]|uniref:Carboxypeptidase Q n=1 Tax=Sphingomonas rosea TaxID=335605 RepID=A0ABP7UAH9_9SPHN
MRILIPALLAAAALPAIAQTPPAPPPPVTVPADVAKLRDAALQDDYAWDITEGLTTEVGQRQAGTEAEARARAWAVARLTAMGFANVRIQPFTMPVWIRGAESAEILAPFPQKMVVAALGNSASTGPAGITGEVVGFDSLDALRAAPDSAVRGKIVFIDHKMAPTQDGSGYGQFGAPRRQGPTIASQKGAVGIVVRSIGTDHHRNPHTGTQSFANGATPIPAGALSVPDAEQMVRILKRGQPIRMHLTLVSRTLADQQSGNVIAEVPGRDPSLAPVLVGGHLDSWDLATGAIDDASGVAIAAAAAKRIMDAGQPLRTIRIVWFGAEEPGLFGGAAYQKSLGTQPHWAMLESDFGADRIWRVTSKLGTERRTEARTIAAALAPLGIVAGSYEEAEGSDIGPMLAAGQPGVGLSQDGTRYFDYHHTPDDTLDKVDKEQLRQNVAAWTATVAVLAGPISPRPAPKAGRRR